MSKLKLPTLLSVTDNAAIRLWIKKHLNHEFFIIDASTRSAALQAAKTAALDFLIIDSEFSDGDALNLCSEMHQMLRTLTPILLITGRLKKTYLEAALAAGASDFLSNQLDADELQVRIATIRKNHSLREKTQEASSALAQPWSELSSAYLKNRFLLHTRALEILKEAKRAGIPAFALILRIDRFDIIQQQAGYLASEQILSPVLQIIARSITPEDLLIPSGNGCFIVVMKNQKEQNARALAERIREQVQQTAFPTAEGTVHVTISSAISSLSGTERDFMHRIDRSFQALDKVQGAANLIISIDKEAP